MIELETFLMKESLVGMLISIRVSASHGIVCEKFILIVPFNSDGISIILTEESTGCRPLQHETFFIFSIIVFESFLI